MKLCNHFNKIKKLILKTYSTSEKGIEEIVRKGLNVHEIIVKDISGGFIFLL
jgi:hypothetical protein